MASVTTPVWFASRVAEARLRGSPPLPGSPRRAPSTPAPPYAGNAVEQCRPPGRQPPAQGAHARATSQQERVPPATTCPRPVRVAHVAPSVSPGCRARQRPGSASCRPRLRSGSDIDPRLNPHHLAGRSPRPAGGLPLRRHPDPRHRCRSGSRRHVQPLPVRAGRAGQFRRRPPSAARAVTPRLSGSPYARRDREHDLVARDDLPSASVPARDPLHWRTVRAGAYR